VACDSSGVLYYHAGDGTQQYKAISFSAYTFPNPAGSGYSSNSNYVFSAAWGTAATQKLLGADLDTSSSGNNFSNYVSLCKFTAEATGSVTSIGVKCSGNGNVKVAIYADNSGQPGSLLNAVNTSTPVSSGWNAITIPTTAITIGTSYWLAVACDSSGVLYYHAGDGTQQYKAISFSAYTFPNPAGSGYSSNSNYVFSAAWG
jgi:hypothetical protein